jgi:abortive infection bacteriophage resistance protein
MTNKQWKSFNQQLAILQDRGLIVDNKQAAIDYLDRIGYYRLSGYWYSFRELKITQDDNGNLSTYRKDDFVKNSRFQDAVKLYIFDKKLRLHALDALERIELAVRVDIAHLLGEKHIHAYEKAHLLDGNFAKKKIKKGNNVGKTLHDLWLERHNSVLHRARREPYVSHYNNKYGKLPIWVSIEAWDFGLMSKLFAGMKAIDQTMIVNKYGAINGKAFAGWLRGFNFIRNVSAHHSRLWNINILERAAPLQNEYWVDINNARAFYYFCLMQKLMKVICPNSTWSKRFIQLTDEFPDVANNKVDLKDFGIIENWKKWSLWS